MQMWVSPPYRWWVPVAFRIFFALNLAGALMNLVIRLEQHLPSRAEIIPVARIAFVMGIAMTAISAFAMWQMRRRNRNLGKLQHDRS